MNNDNIESIPAERFPRHIAVIMDGNGRWAAQRHLPRVEGHRSGIDSVRDVVEGSARLGIKVLTLYAFSVENWKRPPAEVSTLMMLLKRYLRSELNTLLRNNIKFRVVGRMEDLAPDVQRELRDAEERTARLSLSSGARQAPSPQPMSRTLRSGRSRWYSAVATASATLRASRAASPMPPRRYQRSK